MIVGADVRAGLVGRAPARRRRAPRVVAGGGRRPGALDGGRGPAWAGSGAGQKSRRRGDWVFAGSRSTTGSMTSSIDFIVAASSVTPGGLDVLGDLLGPAGADDRGRDVVVLQHPRDGELGQAQPGLVGDRPQPLDPLEHVVLASSADHVRAALVVGGARARRAAADPGGTCRSATPCAIGDQTTWPMPSSWEVGTTSASMTRQSMEYCGWLETSGIRSSRASAWPRRISSARHSETPM